MKSLKEVDRQEMIQKQKKQLIHHWTNKHTKCFDYSLWSQKQRSWTDSEASVSLGGPRQVRSRCIMCSSSHCGSPGPGNNPTGRREPIEHREGTGDKRRVDIRNRQNSNTKKLRWFVGSVHTRATNTRSLNSLLLTG